MLKKCTVTALCAYLLLAAAHLQAVSRSALGDGPGEQEHVLIFSKLEHSASRRIFTSGGLWWLPDGGTIHDAETREGAHRRRFNHCPPADTRFPSWRLLDQCHASVRWGRMSERARPGYRSRVHRRSHAINGRGWTRYGPRGLRATRLSLC